MDRTKILAKIRNLLQMTQDNGCTEAEALTASEKVNALLTEYNLTLNDISDIQEKWGRRGKQGAKSANRPIFHPSVGCVPAIAKFCECIGYVSGVNVVFFGTETNTEFAHYMLDMIKNMMEVEYRKAEPTLKKQTRLHGKTLRNSFMRGMGIRISERLLKLRDERDAAVSATGNALVIVKDAELKKQWAATGTAIVINTTRSRIDSASFNEGKAAGDRVSLDRPLGSRSNKKIAA